MTSYYLKVSELHVIHYQVLGNERDPALILLHGGPGVGCTDNDFRFVKDIAVRAVLIDQRGCGKSTPTGAIHDNTTQDLIEDIVAVMDYLTIRKASILGGSWGSSLAILFAMKYPERIDRLILRGLFLATKESRSKYEDNSTLAYQVLKSHTEENRDSDVWRFYYKMLTRGSNSEQEIFAKKFSEYNLSKISEGKVTQLDLDINMQLLIPINRIKLHYMVNDFFIKDNYIWDNIKLLEHLSITIVHGKFDEVCAPVIVDRFISKLTKASIVWVDAGHNPNDDAIVEGVRRVISHH